MGSPHQTELLHAINPLQIVEHSEKMDTQIRVVYGSAEPAKFSTGSARLIAQLEARGYAVRHRVVPEGTHSWKTTWSPENQRWLLDQLQAHWTPPRTPETPPAASSPPPGESTALPEGDDQHAGEDHQHR